MLYCIKGNPIALQRPRFNMVQRTVYDNQKNIRLVLGINLSNQHGDRPLLTGPLTLYAYFFMPMPTRMPVSQVGKPHSVKPDLDNLVKLLLDISKDIIIKDDKTVAAIHSYKMYSADPKTEFYFTQYYGPNEHCTIQPIMEQNEAKI